MSGKYERVPLDRRQVDPAAYIAALRALNDTTVPGDIIAMRVQVRCADCGKLLGQVCEEPRQTVFHAEFAALIDTGQRGDVRQAPKYTWGKWRLEPEPPLAEPTLHCPRCGPRQITVALLRADLERSRRNERARQGRGTVTLRARALC